MTSVSYKQSTPQALRIPRIKICGITTVEDGIAVATMGADAIGLVFYKPSPRYVTKEVALSIAKAVGPFVTVVGLFVDADADQVQEILDAVPLNLLQFHGAETPQYCDQFALPYMKAIRMRPDIDVVAEVCRYANTSGILLDAYRKGVPGGTGERFDWDRIPASLPSPLILAGGLTHENIEQAVIQVQPYGVDVSGGVESSAGRKDRDNVKQFINRTRLANADSEIR